MTMTPMIVVGCGGTGGKVLVGLRRRLEVELRRRGWNEGIPEAWQLISIDTPQTQEVNLEYGPPLPQEDYVGTAKRFPNYAQIDEALSTTAARGGHLGRLAGWRPAPDLSVPVLEGAGQWRAVGRTVAFQQLGDVSGRLEQAVQACRNGVPQLKRLDVALRPTDVATGGDGETTPRPFVIIVTSMAGGTGAGIFMDICDVLRLIDPGLDNRIMSVLFTAEVFRGQGIVGSGLQPNSLAALAELMAGYYDRDRQEEPLYRHALPRGERQTLSSGPSYPFVVGMSTLGGKDLTDVSDCYRAVTETLLSAMLSAEVYQDLLQHQITNFQSRASENLAGQRFSFANPPDATGSTRSGSMVSSFGSARLSVGSALFEEYAVARLTRESVEFLADGYLSEGRQILGDPSATREQVLTMFKRDRGLNFVEDCGLRELNEPDVEHNQVLEAILPSARITTFNSEIVSNVKKEVSTLGRMNKSAWVETLALVLPKHAAQLDPRVKIEIEAGIASASADLPDRLLRQTSLLLGELGVPVAQAVLEFTKTHVASAAVELRGEAEKYKKRMPEFERLAGTALKDLRQNDRVDADSDMVGGTGGAIHKAASLATFQTHAARCQAAADFLHLFARQVLDPLIAQLLQGAIAVSGPEGRNSVASFPRGEGVPTSYAPSPFDFCLIDHSEWPNLFTTLTRDTALREVEDVRTSDTWQAAVRKMVGGGGFQIEGGGRLTSAPEALQLDDHWTMTRAISPTLNLGVEQIMARARMWVARRTTPIGAFANQTLEAYLLPKDEAGEAIENHEERLDRFTDKLSAALHSARPLIDISDQTFLRVHPNSPLANGPLSTITVEPVPVSGTARERAAPILQSTLKERYDPDRDFGDGSTASESVLIISQLAAPVHPAAVASITKDISKRWDLSSATPQGISTFWQYRRSRVLKEFVPVSPAVLRAMTKGWFLGRAFGNIGAPTEEAGFQIRVGDETSTFPWPLLPSGKLGSNLTNPTHSYQWLPAILESLPLAFIDLHIVQSSLDGYEKLHALGEGASDAINSWIAGSGVDAGAVGPVTRSATPDESIRSLEAVLTQTRDGLTEIRDSIEIEPDPDAFFKLPYGYSFIDEMIEAINEILHNDMPGTAIVIPL